jgi:hypothetical protein
MKCLPQVANAFRRCWLSGVHDSRLIGIARTDVLAVSPLVHRLIVDVGMRFRQECNETVNDSQFDRRRSRVFRTGGTPKVQVNAFAREPVNFGDYTNPNLK